MPNAVAYLSELDRHKFRIVLHTKFYPLVFFQSNFWIL
jgi:hypothetical protein